MKRRSDENLSAEIMDYLSRHPDAQDTVEGIVEWWLLEQRIARAVTEIKAALAELVAKNLITERQDSTGRTYYRLNKTKN